MDDLLGGLNNAKNFYSTLITKLKEREAALNEERERELKRQMDEDDGEDENGGSDGELESGGDGDSQEEEKAAEVSLVASVDDEGSPRGAAWCF